MRGGLGNYIMLAITLLNGQHREKIDASIDHVIRTFIHTGTNETTDLSFRCVADANIFSAHGKQKMAAARRIMQYVTVCQPRSARGLSHQFTGAPNNRLSCPSV